MSLLLALVALLGAGTAPTRTANPIALMNYLPGTWTCSTTFGGGALTYQARYAYDQNQTWLTAIDTSKMGTDRLMISYDKAKHRFRALVADSGGGITVFEAPDTGLAHIVYKSVFPDATMQETFDRISDMHYTTHFRQHTDKGLVTVTDDCRKKA
ncbi:MAG TPA: hypothetical protein VFL13_03850 [Candidatus Baltobacteraceae bacterium]|nr:hypothetical protein [Candidatus Baltobacteraceae bacterium]